MNPKLQNLPTVRLRCESDSPSFDQRPHTVAVVRETDEQWEGYLVRTSDGAVLEAPVLGVWPKFAWTLAEKDTAMNREVYTLTVEGPENKAVIKNGEHRLAICNHEHADREEGEGCAREMFKRLIHFLVLVERCEIVAGGTT